MLVRSGRIFRPGANRWGGRFKTPASAANGHHLPDCGRAANA
jgi:hypothetical protein